MPSFRLHFSFFFVTFLSCLFSFFFAGSNFSRYRGPHLRVDPDSVYFLSRPLSLPLGQILICRPAQVRGVKLARQCVRHLGRGRRRRSRRPEPRRRLRFPRPSLLPGGRAGAPSSRIAKCSKKDHLLSKIYFDKAGKSRPTFVTKALHLLIAE